MSAIKTRLGYDGLSSKSSPRERSQFWADARADGSLLTGTRLYGDASMMADDYGWTADDIDWEIDFVSTEDGCFRSMLCDPARGSIFAVRKNLDLIVVISSLIDNGFRQDQSDPSVWTTSDDRAPFRTVRMLPELHAVAAGNLIGITRISHVVAGAPSLAYHAEPLVEGLNNAESLAYSTGCVSLERAMGPGVKAGDLTAYFNRHDPSRLLTTLRTVVGIDGPGSARIALELASDATSEDLSLRTDLVHSWSSLRQGLPFSDVATASTTGSGNVESLDVDVRRMDVFKAMVLTYDTPWALCPATPSG